MSAMARSGPLVSAEDFDAFYRRESHALTRFFVRRVFEPQTALDLTAESFAQAFIARKKFRGHTQADARAWLHGIGRHQLPRYYRTGAAETRALRRLGLEPPEPSAGDLERLVEMSGVCELRAAVRDGLGRISESHREALQMRIVDEMPYPDIAEQIGVSEQTARARVSRGLRALERAMVHNSTKEMTA